MKEAYEVAHLVLEYSLVDLSSLCASFEVLQASKGMASQLREQQLPVNSIAAGDSTHFKQLLSLSEIVGAACPSLCCTITVGAVFGGLLLVLGLVLLGSRFEFGFGGGGSSVQDRNAQL